MPNGLLRLSEHTTLAQGNVEFLEEGSGRLHTARSKTDQPAEGVALYLCPTGVEVLLTIRSDEAVIDLAFSVLNLSVSRAGQRIEWLRGWRVWPGNWLSVRLSCRRS